MSSIVYFITVDRLFFVNYIVCMSGVGCILRFARMPEETARVSKITYRFNIDLHISIIMSVLSPSFGPAFRQEDLHLFSSPLEYSRKQTK